MSNYVIITDSACDLKPELLKDWGVEFLNLNYRFDGENIEYSNEGTDIKAFYQRIRNGEIAKTSAINPETFVNFFDDVLSRGKDILYMGFSSGLSTTFNSSRIACEELEEKYPDRKILCVDSLCASAGQGLLVYLASQKKNEGYSLEELAKYIEDTRLSVCHWFTVEDLVYLKRGGRVSPAVAFVGGVLGIKPILHVDNEGKLVSVSKVRGRKASLNALVDKFGELSLENGDKTVFISHADAEDDANYIATQFAEKYSADVKVITDIGPVIGAHSGPGTMAVFFLGVER